MAVFEQHFRASVLRNIRNRARRTKNPRLLPNEIGMLIEGLQCLASAYAVAEPQDRPFASKDVAAMLRRLVAAKTVIMVDGE